MQDFIRAIAFAADRHRNQRRKDKDASPYINHPIALANVLAVEGGVNDETVLMAAALHDVLEDTETTEEELVARFGKKVTALVVEVTNDPSLSKPEQKQRQIDHAPYMSEGAKLVKLADKICNLRDILEFPPDWPTLRKQDYFDQAAKVVDGLRGVSPRLEAAFGSVYSRKRELGDLNHRGWWDAECSLPLGGPSSEHTIKKGAGPGPRPA